MEYIFIRDGKQEKVQIERWAWFVKYTDGSQLQQFGEDGVFHQFQEIEQDKVATFGMYKTDDATKKIEIVRSEGMQIFHFYRNQVLNAGTQWQVRHRHYAFGWKKDGVEMYAFILPDDSVILGDCNIQIAYEELSAS